MAPRSGLGDRGRAQVRANFESVGRTPKPQDPAIWHRRPTVGDMLDEYKQLINNGGLSHDEALATIAEKYPLTTTDDLTALSGYINDIGREGDPTGAPRTFRDARAAADPAIQSPGEAARMKSRVLRLRDNPAAGDLIPGKTAEDAARLADYGRPKMSGPSPEAPQSWADRVVSQSGKPVPESAPPLPRPTSTAASPLAQRAQDASTGASLSAPGQFDSPDAIDAAAAPRTPSIGPRTPAAQARAAGTTYEGPGTPPPYRPPGTDPTKGGREAAAAARESRLRGTPEMSDAEVSRLQARASSGIRGGPVEDTVDALYERRNVPGTLRPGAMLTDEIAGMGDDIQSLFRQWVIDPNLDVGKLPAAQRTALTELQARVLSLTPANASVAEFTDAVNAVGQRTFGGASWNPVTPRFDTMTQQQVYDLYKPNPDYNPGGARSIRVGAENMDDVAALNNAAAQREAAAAGLGKPASFAEALAGWDAGTPPAYAGTPPPYYNPGTLPPFAGTPPPYAGTPPPFAGIPPAYNPATATPSPSAAAAFDAGTPPYFAGTPPHYAGTPPPYVAGPPRANLSAPAPSAPAASLAGGGSGGIGGPPVAPPAAAAPGPLHGPVPPVPGGATPTAASGTPPTYNPGSAFSDAVVEQTTARPRGMAGIRSLFGGAAAEGEAGAAGARGLLSGGKGLLSGGKGLLGGAVRSFGVPLAVGAGVSAAGHALGDRLLEGQKDRAGWDQADWGQLASGIGDAAMPMAGLAPLAAAALGAGPAGWAALGIGALGAGAWGLGKALFTDNTATDQRDSLLSDPTLSADDKTYFSGAYDRALAAGATEDQALASVSQQMDQYIASERERRRAEAEQMRYQVTPSQLMTLQTLQMKDMNDLTDQQRLANAAYMAEAQRFAGMPGVNPNIASLALQSANMFNAHAANQAIAYRQAYQMAPLRDMFQAQLDQANRVNNSVASRTASAYAQQLAGLSSNGGQLGQSGQTDLAALLAQQQQAAPAYG